jgi:drug/metabolite transporter (DMT)-like permease
MILTRQFSIKPVFSGLMAFIGIIVLSGLFVRHESLVIGDLFASFCALAFTLHFILLEQFAKTDLKLNSVDPITFTLSQFFAVALISLILSITVELKLYSTITFTPEVIFALAFLAIPTTAFTYLFQFNIQESLSANKVSFLYSFECAFSYLFSLMLGYDKFSLNFLFGTVILLSAMIISSATSRVKVSSS